jgi:hypothetical protein
LRGVDWDNTANAINFSVTSAGYVHARDVLVDLGTVAPDFVFENNYKLKPINEIEQFVKANKHLPNIPSGKELEEKV